MPCQLFVQSNRLSWGLTNFLLFETPPPAARWHHFQQLRNLLGVAGGVGRDAAAEAVDRRAEAIPQRVKLRTADSMAMPCSVKAYIGTAECLYADSRLQRLRFGSFGERAHSGAGA